MPYSSPQYRRPSVQNSYAVSLTSGNTQVGQYENVRAYGSCCVLSFCDVTVDLIIHQSFDDLGNQEVTETISIGPNESRSCILKATYLKIDTVANYGAVSGDIITWNMRDKLSIGTTADTSVPGDERLAHGKSLMVASDSVFGNSVLQSTRRSLNAHITNIPLDVFGRVQVSEPYTLFDSVILYDNNTHEWDKKLTGSGSVVYNTGFPHEFLKVSSSGDRVVRQLHGYLAYQPGKALTALLTGTIINNTSVTNVRSRIGLFDDHQDKVTKTGDGFFFEYENSTVYVVYRTSNSESESPSVTVNEYRIAQTSWNFDKMDGTGVSGYTIDFSKRLIFVVSYEWLGVGRCALGLNIGGFNKWCHIFEFPGGIYGVNPTVAYTTRGSLPMRYEIEATGVPSAAAKMVRICSAAYSEGGYEPTGRVYSYGGDEDPKDVDDVDEPVIAIRLKSDCCRYQVNLSSFNILCTSKGNIQYSVYKVFADDTKTTESSMNGVLSGESWKSSSTVNSLYGSCVELDTDATSHSLNSFKYILIDRGYFSENSDIKVGDLTDKVSISSNIYGVSDMVVITCKSFKNKESVIASVQWKEYG